MKGLRGGTKVKLALIGGVITLIIVAVSIFFVLKNNEDGSQVENLKNLNIGEVAENEEATVYEDGSATLTDDSAIISSLAIINKVTGTGPFDENDEPGNDSSATNNIVRSFDTVTYEIEANMAVNNTDHGSEDAKIYSKFR